MITEPLNSQPVQTFITSTNIPLPPVQRPESWLKHHEKMILATIGGLVLWFAIGRIDTLIANHDRANLEQAKIVAQVQQSKDSALAAQATAQAAQYQVLADKVQAQNAALVAANTQLATALAKQQKVDGTLPPSDLVARWNTLVPQAGATVTPNGVSLPSAGAVSTVQALEQIPVLNSELSNTKVQLANVDSLLLASNGQITTLNAEVSGLRLEAVDQAKVCTAQIAVVKAEARRSKRRWFLAGVVTGWIGRQVVKTYTGL